MAQGGKSHQDRELAAEVRSLCLNEIKDIFIAKKPTAMQVAMKQQLILKMSTSILPRLNEVTGENGKPLKVSFDNAFISTPKGGSS